MPARSCRGRCCCNTYGICILTPRPTSSTSTSDASAARSTASTPTRSSTRSAGSGFASVLLAKTLRSSTLRVALICIGVFGAAILGLFGYVYWATASYVLSRSDATIAADFAGLKTNYDRGGRSGLAAALERRGAARHHVESVYLF